mgnify:CR=1 FL=1
MSSEHTEFGQRSGAFGIDPPDFGVPFLSTDDAGLGHAAGSEIALIDTMLHSLDEAIAQGINTVLRNAGKAGKAAHGRGQGVNAGIASGLDALERFDRLFGEADDRAEFAGTVLGLAFGIVQQGNVDIAGNQVGDDVPAALEGNDGVGDVAGTFFWMIWKMCDWVMVMKV